MKTFPLESVGPPVENAPPFLDELLEVCRRPQPATDEELLAALRRVDVSAAEAVASAMFDVEHYSRWTLLKTDHVQVLLIGWLAGQGSAIHDHSGSLCLFRVLAGCGAEMRYRIRPDGKAVQESVVELPTGEIAASRDADVHRVFNPGVSGPLVTLHVYTPPLNMNYYEEVE